MQIPWACLENEKHIQRWSALQVWEWPGLGRGASGGRLHSLILIKDSDSSSRWDCWWLSVSSCIADCQETLTNVPKVNRAAMQKVTPKLRRSFLFLPDTFPDWTLGRWFFSVFCGFLFPQIGLIYSKICSFGGFLKMVLSLSKNKVKMKTPSVGIHSAKRLK